MGDLAQRVAAAVHHQPRGICFACLAHASRLREHEVRAAALVLIMRSGLRLVRRTCSSCWRTDELLAVKKPA